MWKLLALLYRLKTPRKRREKLVSWQISVAIFSGLALLLLIPLSFAHDKEFTPLGQVGTCILLPLFICVIYLEIRCNHGKDTAPDLLAQLLHVDDIYQLGDAHLALAAKQVGSSIRIAALIQNSREHSGDVRLKVFSKRLQAWQIQIPPLQSTLDGACLAIASTDVPLPTLDAPITIYLQYNGSAKTTGPRVRFARRQAIPTALSKFFAATMAAKFHDSNALMCGPEFNLKLVPFETRAPATPASWKVRNLWTPRYPKQLGELRGELAQMGWEFDEPAAISAEQI